MVFEDKIKEFGDWDLEDSTELDDCAYYLLCIFVYEDELNMKPIPQSEFNGYVTKKKSAHLGEYYKDAQQILRREKIDKLKKIIVNGI